MLAAFLYVFGGWFFGCVTGYLIYRETESKSGTVWKQRSIKWPHPPCYYEWKEFVEEGRRRGVEISVRPVELEPEPRKLTLVN